MHHRIRSPRCLLASDHALPVLLLCLGCLACGTVEAVDCNFTGFDTYTLLRDQDDVDTFQAIYGPCDTVAGSLEVRPDLGPITDLGPLEDLIEVGQWFDVNGSFTDLTGLHNLTTVGETFTISGGSTPLTDLSGLTSLQSVGGLSLIGLNLLENLSGMPNLTTIGGLQLFGLASLTNLNGLPPVLDVDSLVITETEGLSSLDGAPVMSNLRYVRIDATNLTDLSGLSTSEFVSDPPDDSSIEITFNFGLTDLVGLPIGEKFGSINISDNLNLMSLDGLENLVEVWSILSVHDNDRLGDCSLLATVLDAVDDGDPGPGDGINPDDPPDTMGLEYIQIADNGEDIMPESRQCESIEDIVASGDTQVIFEDGFES